MADKQPPRKPRKDRFGWSDGDVEWVISPEQAAEKAAKKPPPKPRPKS